MPPPEDRPGPTDLRGLVVGVWGLGREGHAALAHAGRSAAARLVVADDGQSPATDADVPDRVDGAPVEAAGRDLHRLLACDVVFVNPAVPPSHPFVRTLASRDVPVATGTAHWLAANTHRTVGVTGTKGKSTTASLLGRVLQGLGVPAVVAGNIGRPLLGLPDGTETVVAELSSYQCSRLTRSPRVAVVTNLFEDHLPWHGSRARYWRDKARIFLGGTTHLVTDRETLARFASVGVRPPATVTVHLVDDDPAVAAFTAALGPAGTRALPEPLRAPHAVRNLRCVWAAAGLVAAEPVAAEPVAPEPRHVERPDGVLGDLVRGFEGLPSRLETVAETGGIAWVDDALSTTPESVVAAIQASAGRAPVVVIVGGQSRGLAYEALDGYLQAVAEDVFVVAMPATGQEATAGFAARFPARWAEADTMAGAVAAAAALLGEGGGTVLLSPGAPSFDRYRDYREKSADYRRAVADQSPAGSRSG